MDMLPWIALTKYHHQAHQPAVEVTPPVGMIGPPLGIIATPDILTVITKIGTGSVVPNPTHITMDIGVAAIMTPIGATPGHSTDLPNIATHATEAQVHTTTAMTCRTTDLHPIEFFPRRQQISTTQILQTTLQTSTRIFFRLRSNTLEK